MPFAEPKDVQARLGRSLTSAEEETASAVIAAVTGLIVDCVDRSAEWATSLDPVPEALKAICVEKAISAITNPTSLASESESLGAYQHSQTFQRSSDVGIYLSPFEERLISRAVYGATSGSASAVSMVDRLVQSRDGEELT